MQQVKALIVGLPRSGTTVIANYINSFKNAFVFIEPHWEYKFRSSTDFFRDAKLKPFWFLKYNNRSALPLDSTINRILKKYNVAGFKETYRSNCYQQKVPILPNEELLDQYKKASYKLIPILRHPLDIWNSFLESNPEPDSWSADIKLFCQNYRDFINFFEDATPIIYDRFTENPHEEIIKYSGLKLNDRNESIVRNIKMGDTRANVQSNIQRVKKAKFYSYEDENFIKDSEIVNLYYTYFNK